MIEIKFSSLAKRKKLFFIFSATLVILSSLVVSGLKPVSSDRSPRFFSVKTGESFQEIITGLGSENLIRSRLAFQALAFITGAAHRLKPGLYELSPNLSSSEIISELVRGAEAIEVTIPEGRSIYEVDQILSDKKIILPGTLISFAAQNPIEGKLFPDTYKFFAGAPIEGIVSTFVKNFDSRVDPILKREPSKYQTNLILASLVQKEVSDFEKQKIVAGILKKRLKIGMALQIDSSICYPKKQLHNLEDCYPITPLDFKIDSPYNTYKYKGLPPGPISSPGVSAVQAVLESKSSPYWFYLSDAKTGITYFAENLDEHNRNISAYLKN
ncbi:MAG: endolytic transglycosylase MltG [Candidatus Liptonbacteria bacterium]|nr:endolytic transglycosylase MltG [Candidatus Liptonbacteria bacterium]